MNYEENNVSLYRAASFGNYDEVKYILGLKNCKVNFQNEKGNTPLYIAASRGSMRNLVVIELLLEHKARVDLKNYELQTPLYVAASWGHIDIVNLLIQNNADVNAKNYGERTPLHIAAYHNSDDFPAYNRNGLVTIIDTARRNMGTVLKRYVNYLPNLDIDYMKIWKIANVDDFEEVLDLAIHYTRFGVVAALVEAGANINEVDDGGETPLQKAMHSGHTPMIQFLADNGAI
ncbi:hypothetical protein RN001_014758 [Aquatica leii]|uniref:Uncharacterized protein n=1 Tax=Aquatica leii TaxID=1421715 RepID=A0AAN7SBV4_9COLE|nr:hypothetical protein RN001_014758 [Aquatica leii]